MILTVGKVYRVLYGSTLEWVGVESIWLDKDKRGIVKWRMLHFKSQPRWTWRWTCWHIQESAESFMTLIDRANEIEPPIMTKVKQVEVHYR